MNKKIRHYPSDMDKDMIPICNALNALPGVRTFFCCSGHGRGHDEFYISLGIKNIKMLKFIVKCFDMYGIKDIPDNYSHYLLELDSSFWMLKKSEINLRISNSWVSALDDTKRELEFSRIINRIKKENTIKSKGKR